jgi:predicted phosphodiesterase
MTFLSQVGYVGLIGDVHAEDALLEAALDYLKGKNVEVILCTGDVADGFGSVARCCELLHQNGVRTVRGNHDRWLIADVMRVLPEATDKNELPVGVLDYLTNWR